MGCRSQLAPPRDGFKGAKRGWRGELSYQKRRKTGTLAFPSQRKRVLEVISRRLEGVVRGDFIDSLFGIDERRDTGRCLEVRDTLSLHKEHLLVSKALPIFLASHYFCACSDFSLLCEAYGLSTHSEA
jgi:hypothetical protein